MICWRDVYCSFLDAIEVGLYLQLGFHRQSQILATILARSRTEKEGKGNITEIEP
jgi:hypothetical protein